MSIFKTSSNKASMWSSALIRELALLLLIKLPAVEGLCGLHPEEYEVLALGLEF